ncbi:MAG: hypothetical protein DMF56_09500 [Acidobacteria bacterium]|nr:MAG: hypothetical protein DMF56_09500 [Acidobacteriota bacterium]
MDMSKLEHVFLLMLENRSFDHMLGLSGITGTDAVTGAPTTIDGLAGTESNAYNGTTYAVSQPAPQQMPVDPGHEFTDTLIQLAGPGATYPAGGPYPPINNSGFVADYASSPSPHEGSAPGNYGEIMACFSRLLGVPPLTARDQAASDLLPLLATAARSDAPKTLPEPIAKAATRDDRHVADDNAPITGNLAGFLHIALRYDLAMSPSESRGATIARVRSLKTRGEAADYINEVQAKAATFSGKPPL